MRYSYKIIEHLHTKKVMLRYCDILPQLKGSRGLGDDVRGLFQGLARLLLPLGGNHLPCVNLNFVTFSTILGISQFLLGNTIWTFSWKLCHLTLAWASLEASCNHLFRFWSSLPLLELLGKPRLLQPLPFASLEAAARLSPWASKMDPGLKVKTMIIAICKPPPCQLWFPRDQWLRQAVGEWSEEQNVNLDRTIISRFLGQENYFKISPQPYSPYRTESPAESLSPKCSFSFRICHQNLFYIFLYFWISFDEKTTWGWCLLKVLCCLRHSQRCTLMPWAPIPRGQKIQFGLFFASDFKVTR